MRMRFGRLAILEFDLRRQFELEMPGTGFVAGDDACHGMLGELDLDRLFRHRPVRAARLTLRSVVQQTPS